MERKSKALATEDTEDTEKTRPEAHDQSRKRIAGMSTLLKFSVNSVSSVARFLNWVLIEFRND